MAIDQERLLWIPTILHWSEQVPVVKGPTWDSYEDIKKDWKSDAEGGSSHLYASAETLLSGGDPPDPEDHMPLILWQVPWRRLSHNDEVLEARSLRYFVDAIGKIAPMVVFGYRSHFMPVHSFTAHGDRNRFAMEIQPETRILIISNVSMQRLNRRF